MRVGVQSHVADNEVVGDAYLESAGDALSGQSAHKGVGKDHITPHKLPQDGHFEGTGSIRHNLEGKRVRNISQDKGRLSG